MKSSKSCAHFQDTSKIDQVGNVCIDHTHPRHATTEQDTIAYDERSASFDATRALELGRPDFTDPLRMLGKDAVILELAAGRAAHSLSLLENGFQVVVTDVSQKSVEWVERTANALRIAGRASFVVVDAMHLPFEDESFDGVFMTASLHHMPDPLVCLREIRRVLRPKGILLIGYEPAKWTYQLFGPSWRFFRRILRKGRCHEVSWADDDTEGFSANGLLHLAGEAGFVKAEVTGVDFFSKIYEHVVTLIRKCFRMADSEYRVKSKLLKVIDRRFFQHRKLTRIAWNYDLRAERA